MEQRKKERANKTSSKRQRKPPVAGGPWKKDGYSVEKKLHKRTRGSDGERAVTGVERVTRQKKEHIRKEAPCPDQNQHKGGQRGSQVVEEEKESPFWEKLVQYWGVFKKHKRRASKEGGFWGGFQKKVDC